MCLSKIPRQENPPPSRSTPVGLHSPLVTCWIFMLQSQISSAFPLHTYNPLTEFKCPSCCSSNQIINHVVPLSLSFPTFYLLLKPALSRQSRCRISTQREPKIPDFPDSQYIQELSRLTFFRHGAFSSVRHPLRVLSVSVS